MIRLKDDNLLYKYKFPCRRRRCADAVSPRRNTVIYYYIWRSLLLIVVDDDLEQRFKIHDFYVVDVIFPDAKKDQITGSILCQIA
jgi:hypothetical protein